MASHIEMHRVAHDPAAVRSMAIRLIHTTHASWSDWERDFLDNMAAFEGPAALTERQREKLFELRDNVEILTNVQGFSISILARKCYLLRDDIGDEDDEAWVTQLHETGVKSLMRRPAYRLLALSKRLELVDQFAD